MLFYTDGLIERRGVPLDAGLAWLTGAVADAARLPLGELCDQLLTELAGVVEEDASVRGALERGDPPGRSGRSSLARLCGRLLRERPEVAA